jgi:hypothetical protein
VAAIGALLEKLLPDAADSAYRRTRKALASVWREKDVLAAQRRLATSLQLLTLYFTQRSAAWVDALATTVATTALGQRQVGDDVNADDNGERELLLERGGGLYDVPPLRVAHMVERPALLEALSKAFGRKDNLGPHHPSTLLAMHDLGCRYHGQGEWAKMYQRALAGREEALGHHHPDTLAVASGLASLYYEQGDKVKARDMWQQVLARQEAALGPSHLDMLATASTLGFLYVGLGELAKAEEMYQRALAGREAALGPDNPLTLRTMHLSAVLYRKQGRLALAERTARRPLAGAQKNLGDDDKVALDSTYEHGVILGIMNKYADAETLLDQALTGYKKVGGKEHESTQRAATTIQQLHDKRRASKDVVVASHSSTSGASDRQAERRDEGKCPQSPLSSKTADEYLLLQDA